MMKEIEAIESSSRRKATVAIVATIGLAAGLYFAFGSAGTGEPEQADRVLIVADTTVGLGTYTDRLGFTTVSGSFEAWGQEIVTQEADFDDPGAVGFPAILEFADRHGYGYVLVEEPQRLELASLGLEFSVEAGLGHQDPGAIPDRARFAVISVGDFASPHVLTTELSGRDRSEGTRDVDVGIGPKALRALFAQPQLAATLDTSAEATATQTLRLKLLDAVEALERNERLEAKARRFADEEREQLESIVARGHDQPAVSLVRPLEGASTYALADGRILVRGVQARPELRDNELSIALAPLYTYSAIAPGSPATAAARQACPEFMGGGGPRRELARFEISAEGDALFVLDEYGEGTLFNLDPKDPALGPCGLRPVARFELPDDTRSDFAAHRDAIATRDVEDGRLFVEVIDREDTTARLAEMDASVASSLIWLDDRRIGVLVDFEDGSEAVVIVDRFHPEAIVVLPLVDPARPALEMVSRELQPIPGPNAALVYRWNIGEDFHFSRIDLARPWSALFPDELPAEALGGAPDTDTELPNEFGVNPGVEVTRLSAEELTWTHVSSDDAHVRGFAIHPEGHTIAMTYDGDLGVDVGVVPLPARGGPAGPRRAIIDDIYEHREVAFRWPSSGHESDLLFRTRIRLDVPGASLMVSHAAPSKL